MKRPDIKRLPTSQMMAFCDLLGIPRDKQDSIESMVKELEAADFRGLKIVFKPDESFVRPWLEKGK